MDYQPFLALQPNLNQAVILAVGPSERLYADGATRNDQIIEATVDRLLEDRKP